MILPAIQATMKDGGRMIIPFSAYPEELGKSNPARKWPLIWPIWIWSPCSCTEKKLGEKYGIFDIEMIFNSMPPITGYVHPPQEMKVIH